MDKKINYTSIELFAGAGGLALGLEQAGFNHIALIEKDKDASNTLKLNRPNWKVFCEDITEITERDLEKEFGVKKGELDLLSGGAPCQSFSTAGKKLGIEDTRGTMFYYYAYFLEKLQPKMFIFENVKGLLTHHKHETFNIIQNVFKEAGYQIQYQVLDAWDYGVPQIRKRLITIGIRNDIAEKVKYDFPKPHDYKPVIGDIELEVNPDKSRCSYYSAKKYNYMAQIPPGGWWSCLPEDQAKEYMKNCIYFNGIKQGFLRRMKLDEPCLTIMTSPSSKFCDRGHPLEIRPFSYRENARLQSFPDDWEFSGSLTSKYRQIGNAVPCALAKDIGISVISTLNQLEGI